MRCTVDLGPAGTWHWKALYEQGSFLFRRVADQGRDVLGVGIQQAFTCGDAGERRGRLIDEWAEWWDLHALDEWVMGHVGYDVKNGLEDLRSKANDENGWPDLHWFIPTWVFERRDGRDWLHAREADLAQGLALHARMALGPQAATDPGTAASVHWRLPERAGYLEHARSLLGHIHRGDIYEVNLCVEQAAVEQGWDPYSAFDKALRRSGAPFAGFYRSGDRYALIFSPERFLALGPGMAVSQPMKGTRPRHPDQAVDQALAIELGGDKKERAENIMAVDVVRNDLSRVAAAGGVEVEELCVVRSYPMVHQMLSTVSGRLAPGIGPVHTIAACFPPASMTGAPKISAMRLIDEVEGMRRGLYSGALGFVDPDGRGDLSVVIRTVQYRADTGHLSLMTGSALTATCDVEKEWEECRLKAASVLQFVGP